ncbi:CFEM domain-containing protein [Scedosporium apiospermum]|uniref:CFEM domain-containing protein n=1 Tax=Pseudallescheria apiosperma TaxID=563466 RepID=A0A084GGU1_PSEDA|nr:CFEM domain-containing protein [Scedosporium apiospermum]KEZ46553.1 CFEM domain-containing protein [Scedosporium apiospermum]
MRLRHILAPAALLLGWVPVTLSQGLPSSLPSSLDSLPDCAIRCLKTSVTNSACSIDDFACLCTNSDLQNALTDCALASCTMKESLFAKNVTQSSCNAPIRNRSRGIKDVTTILSIITGVLVAGRLVFKQFIAKMGLSMDDWFILITTIVGAVTKVIIVYGTLANGVGQDVWTLPFDMITRFGMYFYIMEVFYFAEVTLLKVSILFFYLRIFPEPRIRRVLWATQILNVLVGVAFVITSIFQCTPISHFWTSWTGETKGKCVNVNALAWANAIISIVLDILMLAIPLSQLPKIKLHWKRKVGIALMFFVGTFVTVVSILRLHSLVTFATSQNQTWDNAPVTKWSIIEINVGVICACMPTLRLALARAFRIFQESTVRTGYGAGYGAGYQNQSSKITNSRAVATFTGQPSQEAQPPDHAILCKKTFDVQYSDESSLVHMRDLSARPTTSDASSGLDPEDRR